MTYVEQGMVMYTYEDLCEPGLAQELLDAGAVRTWEVDTYVRRTRGPNAMIDGRAWRMVHDERDAIHHITFKINQEADDLVLPPYAPWDAEVCMRMLYTTARFRELYEGHFIEPEGEQP